FAYVTHNLGRFHLPTTQLERGWMNTSALSIIDLEEREWLTTVLLDDVDLGAANPWGVACADEGQSIVVAHSGTHELSRIDRQGLHDKIDRVANGEQVSEVSRNLESIPNDLAFLVDLRERIALPGNGPRGVAIADDNTVAVTEYFTDSLALVDLSGDTASSVEQILLGEQTELSEVREGEKAFHDADFCFQKWQSCASCHPDARADALNWDLLNDGIGNPKNTKSLLLSHETPPVMITGIREDAETAVRAGFRFIQFVEAPDEMAEPVDAYLTALQPLPSPRLADGELSPAAQRGKEIFERANCAECHSGAYYTDGQLHDPGTGPDEQGLREFVTPYLNEVWRTGPYLYDGGAGTMMDVLTGFNADDQHGATSELTSSELDDVAEYILSL
ncbi:MAG: c-type cytochrome, partial [Candidatus Hydrogenedentota bacterium]